MPKSIPQKEFDRSQIVQLPLAFRHNKLERQIIRPLELALQVDPSFRSVAKAIKTASKTGASIIFMLGAHVLRSGVQNYLIDLMASGQISCLAMNGAGVIHDYELALIGGTTEDVGHYIKDGRFGLWQETARINDIVKQAAAEGRGLGEAVGRIIESENFPHRDISVLAAAYRFGIPVTVHVGIGYDIVHEHPNCDGAAYGATSYTDFLRFAEIVQSLENGVVMNFGSAVMAPEIFLKALAMARNVANQHKRKINHFTTLVCDLVKLPENYHTEAAPDDPAYYFRPWKTMLIRTVKDGGKSYYVRGYHKDTVPQLWTSLEQAREKQK